MDSSHRYSYLALGDSYTCAEAVEPKLSYPNQFAVELRKNGIDVADPKVIATTGWTTAELRQGIRLEGRLGTFDLVTLLIGVNNQYRGLSLDNYKTEFAQLLAQAVELAGGKPSHVVVISIPDWGVTPFGRQSKRHGISQEIDAFNAAARAICEQAKVAFVDITPLSRQAATDPSLVAADGLHPSGKMYTEWVPLILPQAEKVFR